MAQSVKGVMSWFAGDYSNVIQPDQAVEEGSQNAEQGFGELTEEVNDDSKHGLAVLFDNAEAKTDKDMPEAVVVYRQAAEQGNAQALTNLGVQFRDGKGVEQDPEEAAALFRQAAKLGNAKAMCSLGMLMEHGDGTRRDIPGAVEMLEQAERTDPSHSVIKTTLARLLLSEEAGALRNPAKAAKLLEGSIKVNPNSGYTLHELAVLYTLGEDGVQEDRDRATTLFSLAASEGSYENVKVFQSERIVIEAGEYYPQVIDEILRASFAKPRTCLLLTLGGGGRGKTSTVNSLRGLPFVAEHVPTEMAALNKFVLEPGVRGLAEDITVEYDFNENSLRANASRLHKQVVSESEKQSRSKNQVGRDLASQPSLANKQTFSSSGPSNSVGSLLERSNALGSIFNVKEGPHADVIERVRRSLLLAKIPTGFRGSVVQVWDMAGQSQYEMAHSMVIARGSILVFVTDLERVADERTREDEVGLLCYWMQLAHVLVLNASRIRVLVVGTRKAKCCAEATVRILKDSLAKQLAPNVYDSWIRTRPGDSRISDVSKFIAVENSTSLGTPKSSGLDELEQAVKAAGDEVVAARDAIPMRWLALVDKLEREYRSFGRMYFRREDVRQLCVQFPGYTEDEREREKDVVEGLRCFASMGRLVLFELGEKEWYVFMDVQKIISLLGKVTAPEERLRDRLSIEDLRGLTEGRISQKALFSLWDGHTEEDKRLMLKLLCRFDLLMLLTGTEESIVDGVATVGVPAMMRSGWEDFKWGRVAGEKDLEVTTQFEEAIPNGLIGFLIAHLHRTHLAEDADGSGRAGASLRVRADAVLMRVRDGSRVFVSCKGAERKLCWKFRGLDPVLLAKEFIGGMEGLLNYPSNVMSVAHRHIIVLDCQSSQGGCGAPGAVEVELPKQWILEDSGSLLPTEDVSCESCFRPWSDMDIYQVLWPSTRSRNGNSIRDLGEMQRLMPPRKYDVFISHAGPDKLTLAEPLYKGLTWHTLRAFLDKEGLQIHEATAPEEMERAMGEARVGIFILSPEFAAREWTLRELRRFLERDKRSVAEGRTRPVLLPVFFRLSVYDCARCEVRIYGEDSEHRELLMRSGFFERERQAKCSTEEAVMAFKELRTYSGVEVSRIGGGEDLSSAGVMTETVRRVIDYMRNKGLV